eukprot:SAG31_NODE_7831_length_1587_cov_1.715726_2_plen_38_part_01
MDERGTPVAKTEHWSANPTIPTLSSTLTAPCPPTRSQA